MLIARDQLIVGLPAPVVRDVLRELTRWPRTLDEIDKLLADAGATQPIDTRQALLDERWIELDEHSSRSERFGTSVAGGALAKARIGKPMKRAKAEALLAEVLDRVREVNEDPNALWWVKTVELFGSLADGDRTEVGDVDLRIVLTARHAGEEHFARVYAVADAADRSFSTHIDRLGYASFELYRRIRGRSNRVDIQFDHDNPRPLPDGAVTRELYRRTT